MSCLSYSRRFAHPNNIRCTIPIRKPLMRGPYLAYCFTQILGPKDILTPYESRLLFPTSTTMKITVTFSSLKPTHRLFSRTCRLPVFWWWKCLLIFGILYGFIAAKVVPVVILCSHTNLLRQSWLLRVLYHLFDTVFTALCPSCVFAMNLRIKSEIFSLEY
jgi:hypothetical protein